MNKKLSDEQLDKLLQNLWRQNACNDDEINEIADSTKLWRDIKNRIDTERSKSSKFAFFNFSIQNFALASLAIFVCFGLFILSALKKQPVETAQIKTARQFENSSPVSNAANKTEEINDIAKVAENNISESLTVQKITARKPINKTSKNKFAEKSAVKSMPIISKPPANLTTAAEIAAKKPAEIKSDFIALAYSPAPESGQIVRVKVPRSMMVSLGITSDVEKNSEMVNAEVIVGDDGLAHSIRFVR